MKILSFLLAVALPFSCDAREANGTTHPCAGIARTQAAQLIQFHLSTGEGEKDSEQISIDDKVKLMPSIRNPAQSTQRLTVLELWGYKGKGEFRLRLIYMKTDLNECLPVGREIMSWATF